MYLCQAKSKGQAEPTPLRTPSLSGNKEKEEREREGRRMFPNETTQDIPIGLLTPRSAPFEFLPASILSLFLPLRPPPPCPCPLCSRNNHTVGRVHTIAPRSWHEHRVRGRSCASTPSFAPETVYNPLPSLQATVLPPHGEHTAFLSIAPSLIVLTPRIITHRCPWKWLCKDWTIWEERLSPFVSFNFCGFFIWTISFNYPSASILRIFFFFFFLAQQSDC